MDPRRLPRLEQLYRDIWFAARLLRKEPFFTIAVIFSLGMGIAANVTVFSLLNALSLRPLPVERPQQLVRIGSLDKNGSPRALPSPALDDLRRQPLLQGVCGFTAGDAIVEAAGKSAPLAALSLTGDCYKTLGVRPAVGRLFTFTDDIPNGPKVAVLGYDYWKATFAGDSAVIGQTIRISGSAFQIIGVTEPRFKGLLWGYPPSISAPISQRTIATPNDPTGRFYWAETLARLRPFARADQLLSRLKVEWPDFLNRSLPAGLHGVDRRNLLDMPPVVTSGAAGIDYYFRDHFQSSLIALLAVSILIFLVSCLNTATLLLARGFRRRREISIRLAIGAARGRIVRQLLAESTLLVTASLVAGHAFSLVGVNVAIATLTDAYSRSDLVFEAQADWRVLLFTASVGVAAALLFGVLPAWQTSEVDPVTALRDASLSITGGQTQIRRWLISGQVAITLVILVATGVFATSLHSLYDSALRIDSKRVLDAQLMPRAGGDVDGEQAIRYFRNLMDRIKVLPAVDSVSLTSFAPLVSSPYRASIQRLGDPDAPALQASTEFVTEDFLSIMNIPLLAGSNFATADVPRSTRVGIVSASVAGRLFGTTRAIGQHVQIGTETEMRDIRIIGVAADAPLEDVHERRQDFVLLNLWQFPGKGNWGNLQVRFSGRPELVSAQLRNVIAKSGHQEVFLLRTMSELRAMALLQEKLLATIGRIYSLLALCLSAVGLFGLLVLFVNTRKAEIAVRLALGAERNDIAWLLGRETLTLIALGVAIGLPFAFGAVRALSSALYGVHPLSLISIALPVAILLAVGAIASIGPILRTRSIEPGSILRQA